MDTKYEPIHPTFIFHQVPAEVSRRNFNRSINPHLHSPHQGPKPKLSLYKIFHYILYVWHTGMEWEQLKPQRNALHYTNVYAWHNRWSKGGGAGQDAYREGVF